MIALTATPCLGCNALTTGSIGATGTRWPFICQPCKNAADREALANVTTVNRVVATVMRTLGGDDDIECATCGGYGAAERGDGTECGSCAGEGRVTECGDCGHDYRRGERCKRGC